LSLQFFVDGTPRPKQSFRFTTRSGKPAGFQPVRVKEWQNLVRLRASEAIAGRQEFPLVDGLKVMLEFNLPDKKRRDSDNLSKGTLDALNGIVWEDDNQVTDLHIIKRVEPKNVGVLVTVEEHCQ